MLRAWRACGRFDPTRAEPLGGWLRTITRNVAVDMARARSVRPAPTSDPVGATGPAPADPADRLVERSLLLDALATITLDQRTAIVATVVHDRHYRCTAAALDVPEGTVKTRVFHGLRRMRVHLTAA